MNTNTTRESCASYNYAPFQPPLADVVLESLQTNHITLSLERIANGFEHPWSVAFLPNGRYLVSERSGQLKLVEPASRETSTLTLENLPDVSTQGQGGLLDIVLHPDFEGESSNRDNDWIYFTWSKPDGNNTRSALSRVKEQGDELDEVEHLFSQNRASEPGRHYGSRLAWLPDGTLLMSLGDRGRGPSRAQASGDHAGSTLPLTATGAFQMTISLVSGKVICWPVGLAARSYFTCV